MPARRFVQVIGALDVGRQDRFERPFDRDAAQVDDRVHALDQRIDRLRVGQVARHDFLARARGAQLGNVGQAQHIGIAREPLAQHLAEVAARAGQQ